MAKIMIDQKKAVAARKYRRKLALAIAILIVAHVILGYLG